MVGGHFQNVSSASGVKIANSLAIWNGADWTTFSTGNNYFLNNNSNYNLNNRNVLALVRKSSMGFCNDYEWHGYVVSSHCSVIFQSCFFKTKFLQKSKLSRYVAGSFGGWPTSFPTNIASWNGTSWSALGNSSSNGLDNGANCLAMLKNKL